jgi:hypothetical protein
MAVPIIVVNGNLSCATASTDLNYLLNTAMRLGADSQPIGNLSIQASEYDNTLADGSGLTAMEYAAGLRQGEVTFGGLWPKATAPLGNSGLITYAAGYVQRVTAYSITFEWGENDITTQTGAGVSWRTFMPGRMLTWSGSYTAIAVSGTAASLPSTGLSTSATFKWAETGTTDGSFAGNIITTQLSQNVQTGERSDLQYTFKGSGACTQTPATTGAGLLYSTARVMGPPDWDTTGDGIPDVSVVLKVDGSRTYTFPAFLRTLTVTTRMDKPMLVTGTLRAAGEIVVA